MEIGLERLASMPDLTRRLRGARVGLLTHPAAVRADMAHAAEALRAAGVSPALLFGPEHGYGGEAQDMIGVAGAEDVRSGAPIVSLYGESFDDLSPRAEHLSAIDVLVIDLADVGARYYTFVWTALLALRAAARAGVHVVLLDRPNPISGAVATIEGRAQEPGFLSFVGLEAVPVRHAMTVGELLVHFAERDKLPLGDSGALRVVGVRGWDRNQGARTWDRAFVMPSPNMPTETTALVYPGGCLLEGTNLSEGRGTTRPFEIVGAPWIDGHRLASDLHSLALPGFIARAITFRPTFHKHAGTSCGGVQIHPTEERTFLPYATYLALCALARRQSPERFAFRTERYEYVDDIPAFDLLTGSATARRAIERDEDPRDIAEAASPADPGWPDRVEHARRLLEANDC